MIKSVEINNGTLNIYVVYVIGRFQSQSNTLFGLF